MKILRRLLFLLLSIYVIFWTVLAMYFSVAETHKGLLESNLSTIFKKNVQIKEVITAWSGLSPTIQINGLHVEGELTDVPTLAFDSVSAEISPWSILTFWPKFTEFAVNRPQVEIVSLGANKLQVAGFILGNKNISATNPKRLISWLLNHESSAWLDGEIIWRRLNGEQHKYSDISFLYQRAAQHRSVNATVLTSKGHLAFKAESNGDVIKADNWDASVEILGNRTQQLLSPEDISLYVEDGKGELQLKTLDIQRIRDFLRLTGIGGDSNWVLMSQLTGKLNDVRLDFYGPLLDFKDWQLSAAASEVSFQSVDPVPAMDNLKGQLVASASGGKFNFAAENSTFNWPRWFDNALLINRAKGDFEWNIKSNGLVEVQLSNGSFLDDTVTIEKLNARADLNRNRKSISSFGQLFKLSSVSDLGYKGGELTDSSKGNQHVTPLFLDASAEVEVSNLANIELYVPNDPRLTKFHTWWKNAFKSGVARNGKIRYQGEVSKTAIYEGKASLTGEAQFSDVALDYGYQRNWPKVLDGNGIVKIDNSSVRIFPESVVIEGAEVKAAEVEILSVFRLDRSIRLKAEIESTLQQSMDFLFSGPLLKPSNKKNKKPLPVSAEHGNVSTLIDVDIPLAKVRNAKVSGVSKVTDGVVSLPSGMPVKNISADISFTEKSAESNTITATFLGGATQAKLVTTQQAQPPKMALDASGVAFAKELEPWVGEHLLSWFSGQTKWQSNILIDGPRATILTNSDLLGIDVTVPKPIGKSKIDKAPFSLRFDLGLNVPQRLKINYGNDLKATFIGDLSKKNNLFDSSMISLGSDANPKPGINFDIKQDSLNLDDWLDEIITLATLKTRRAQDTLFLDSMRNINLQVNDPVLMGRDFEQIEFSGVSVDGKYWIGSINGKNINGTFQAEPRTNTGQYKFDLSSLEIVEDPPAKPLLQPIDQTLSPKKYPSIELDVARFKYEGRNLGKLKLSGETIGDVWKLTDFSMTHNGIVTSATGQWSNDNADGSTSRFSIKTDIDEAGGVLDDMKFDGVVKKGEGSFKADISWRGSPHEFDYTRLNGNFDLRIKDGELVKIEPGSGKLLGLLNFNAIARRLTLDFRDLFSSGLTFDQMRYAGVFADGEAIMQEAFIFTPAVFVRMEGKVDLAKELIDMEVHVSPELGGNLTLLSALANPAAGAVVYLTQRLFKDEMRSASFRSYRALGTWKDFELEEFNPNE